MTSPSLFLPFTPTKLRKSTVIRRSTTQTLTNKGMCVSISSVRTGSLSSISTLSSTA